MEERAKKLDNVFLIRNNAGQILKARFILVWKWPTAHRWQWDSLFWLQWVLAEILAGKLETAGSMEERKSDPLARAQGCESGHLAESAALPQTFFMRLHIHVNSIVECPLQCDNNVRLMLDSAWHGDEPSRCSQMRFSLHINMVKLHLDIAPYQTISGMAGPLVQHEHVHIITTETTTEDLVRYICCRRIQGSVQEGQMEKYIVPKKPNIPFTHGERTRPPLL